MGDRQRGIDRLIQAKKYLEEWLEWTDSLPTVDTVIWRPPKKLVNKTRKVLRK